MKNQGKTKDILKWLAVAPFGKPMTLPSQNRIVAFKTPRTDLKNPDQCIPVRNFMDHYQ